MVVGMKGMKPEKKQMFSQEAVGSIYHRNTARRQRIGDLCAVFLFLLLLPYACSLLFGKDTAVVSGHVLPDAQEGISVICRESAGERAIPLETYVEGALAASIPMTCEEETLKAQAVILRTMCMRVCEREDRNRISAQEIGQVYLDGAEQERLWGAACEENREKAARAVTATAGIYMTAQGQAIEPAYFWLSAGRTRDGREVLGEEYACMTGVDCGHDMEAENFLQSVDVEEARFWELLGLQKQEKLSLVRDSAGYVLWLEAGDKKIPGEEMRSRFMLPSACFSMENEGGRVTFTCKGEGHGLGFCQHEADRRAAEGADYIALLKVFFQDIELEKIAE